MTDHLDHETLVLLYYKELDSNQVVESENHLTQCSSCNEEYQDIAGVLDVVPLAPPASTMDWDAFMAHSRWRRKGTTKKGWGFLKIAAIWTMFLGGAAALGMWGLNIENNPGPATAEFTPPVPTLEAEPAKEDDPLVHYLAASNELLLDVLDSPLSCDLEGQDIQGQKDFGEILAHERQQAIASAEIVPVRYEQLINDLDGVLQTLGTLDSCAQHEDLVSLQKNIKEKDLLMRMHLTLGELKAKAPMGEVEEEVPVETANEEN